MNVLKSFDDFKKKKKCTKIKENVDEGTSHQLWNSELTCVLDDSQPANPPSG